MSESVLSTFGKTPKAAARCAVAVFLSFALAFAMPISQVAYADSLDPQAESSATFPEETAAPTEGSDDAQDSAIVPEQPAQKDAEGVQDQVEAEDDIASVPAGGADEEATVPGDSTQGEGGGQTETVASEETDGALVQENGFYRYLLNDGTYLKDSWKELDGKKYYFDSEGNALIGKQEIEGALYFFNEKGQAVKGWKTIDGKKYYFNPETFKAVKFKQTIDGKLYYFNAKCEQRTGWVVWNSDSRKTYFNPDRGGAAAKGWWKIAGKRYYFDAQYKAVKGKQTIKGKLYYFNNKCEQRTGWIIWKEDNRRSYFHPDRGGAAAKGWWTIGNNRYYFDKQGKAVRFKRVIDGKTYYFNGKGKMQTGWVLWADGTHSYFGSNGVMYTGTRVVNGKTYNFGANGKTRASIPAKDRMTSRAQQYQSPTNWLILVDRSSQRVGIFYGEKNSWELRKYWICSTGLPGRTATPLGENHAIGYRGPSFGDGTFICYWYTQFYKRCLFHSSPYIPGTSIIMDGTMGVPSSHGCIRLYIDRAKWIHDNIPRDTRVVIYK